MLKVCDELKEFALLRDGTITRVAERLGFARPAVHRTLNGQAAISMKFAFRYEELYHISADTIMKWQLQEQLAAYRQERKK